jgi:hypothetical protein
MRQLTTLQEGAEKNKLRVNRPYGCYLTISDISDDDCASCQNVTVPLAMTSSSQMFARVPNRAQHDILFMS